METEEFTRSDGNPQGEVRSRELAEFTRYGWNGTLPEHYGGELDLDTKRAKVRNVPLPDNRANRSVSQIQLHRE